LAARVRAADHAGSRTLEGELDVEGLECDRQQSLDKNLEEPVHVDQEGETVGLASDEHVSRTQTVEEQPRKCVGIPIVFIESVVGHPVADSLQVEIVRQANKKVARRYPLPQAIPQQPQRVEWDGLTGAGRVAANGRYRVRIAALGGPARTAGSLTLRSHVFPIRGAHADRGPIGAFGVGRSGGRRHNGFDVNAACGTPLVAARGGRVRRRGYDPVLYGNYVIIRGRLTQRDYWYVHLQRPAPVRVGQQVGTGQLIGRVGATGNARTIGCHLHFELRVRGRPIDPRPELHAWDVWG